jgi:two-component system sensor kinase FixL
MSRLETFLGYAESHRISVCAIAGGMVAVIGWADFQLPTLSIGFLYLIPILISAAVLNGLQIVALAGLCSFLQELFAPLGWSAGATDRLLVVLSGFALTGFFATQLIQRRRLLHKNLLELETEIRLRQDAESQVRILIETSPLAILTIDEPGRVLLANESARQLFDFEGESLQGIDVAQYLPILPRMLHSHHSSGNIRTNVECNAKRRGGDVFLASVWISTYRTSSGPGLAAVIWDASENLRDREGAGLDSLLATSRVLIGAISHEIRNLASAAASSYAALASLDGVARNGQYEALGTLIRALETIATSGLHMAAHREPAIAHLGTVLDEARIVIEPSLREAGFTVNWSIDEDLALVQGDQHSLLQVFVNLARNVLQHGAEWPRREVCISATLENDLVVIRFQDTGPGVARPDELFQPFQPTAQSCGLGLYISRAILRSYGGNLRYEPSGRGASFAVELWPVENAVEA